MTISRVGLALRPSEETVYEGLTFGGEPLTFGGEQLVTASGEKTLSGVHDIYLNENGELAMVTDAEAVGQHVRQRLMTHEGEWFLDKSAGVTWLTDVLGQGYDPIIAESLTKTEILETDGVSDILEFSVRFDRSVRGVTSYNISVETEYDEKVSV